MEQVKIKKNREHFINKECKKWDFVNYGTDVNRLYF